MSNLFEPVANCSEQTANQNTNIAAEVWKVGWKRTSGLTVIICYGKSFGVPCFSLNPVFKAVMLSVNCAVLYSAFVQSFESSE